MLGLLLRNFHLPGRSPVIAVNGMCATSHPLAAQTAIRILQDGGNAVDAAIAAAFLLGICEPQMTGIGGDCFALLKPAGSEQILALNGSGRSPAGLNADMMRNDGHQTMPKTSAHAVTVPGAVDAFCRLSQDWGKLGIAASLQPAIHYGEQGVPVAARTAFDWNIAAGKLQGVAKAFYLKADRPLIQGDIFSHARHSDVLRRIASDGRKAFYEGEVAQDMVTSLRNAGGVHTLDDFAATACEYTDPIAGSYRDLELVEHPPNGQGATAILMAKILGHFNLTRLDPRGAARAHIEAEAAKLAYDARNRFIADADHTIRSVHMVSDQTAAALAALIDPDKILADPKPPTDAVHRDTVYLTVVDKDLMAVSLIYSIYHSFGSGLASDKFGILFQNRGAGFNLIPGHPNECGGGKRPMHTIIPGMLRKGGRVIMPFGIMGGAYQPNGHVRFVSNIADFVMDPQTAIDAPRSFHDAGELKVEQGYSEECRQQLRDMGHRVTIPEAPIGGGQAIYIDHQNGTLHGASDPRKDGAAIGY